MHMKKTRLLVTTADADNSLEFILLLDYSTTRSLHEIAALFINSLHLKKKNSLLNATTTIMWF